MKLYHLIFASMAAFAAVLPTDGWGAPSTAGGCDCEQIETIPGGTNSVNVIEDRFCTSIIYNKCKQQGSDNTGPVVWVESCTGCRYGRKIMPTFYPFKTTGSGTGCQVPYDYCACPEDDDYPTDPDSYDEQVLDVLYPSEYCERGDVYYYKYGYDNMKVKYTSCRACKLGGNYTTRSFEELPNVDGCPGPQNIHVCEPPVEPICDEDTCTKDNATWKAYSASAGIMYRETKACNANGECVVQSTQYKCASGYCSDQPGNASVDNVNSLTCTSHGDIVAVPVGDWTAHNTGYEKQRWVKKCLNVEIERTEFYKYRCAAGYYGTSTDGASGCSPCPLADGGKTTSSPGSETRDRCCVTMNDDTEYEDAGGYFIFVGDPNDTTAKCCVAP